VIFMPYPAKTDRQAILSAAVKELAQGGIRDLSLRNVAASLGLTPNAIYRYFPDRRALEAAISSEAAQAMERALRSSSEGCKPIAALQKMASAYIQFARDNQSLYEAMMSFHVPEHDPTFHESLWSFTVEQVQRLAGPDRAAKASVALWAHLHGAVTLESVHVLGDLKPTSGLEFGFEAWLAAVSGESIPVEAGRTQRTSKTAAEKQSTRQKAKRVER
jgi:AcrR family transcriptional regulator